MERTALGNHDIIARDYETLKFAEYFSGVTTIIESLSGRHYSFRKFLWLGNWGICNAEKTKILVKAKANYSTVEILVFAQLLIAGNQNIGWDVMSLEGKFLRHLPPMSIDKATTTLNEAKRNHH